MAKSIEVNVGDVLTKIEFKDKNGELLGWLRFNPADERLIGRLGAFAETFRNWKPDEKKAGGLSEATVEAFSNLLGYDCKDTLFGVLGPLTPLESGGMYAGEIMKKITEEFIAEAKRRMEKRTAAMKKHTAKYEHDGV